ncbi:MAG: DUF2141 domain-containing protein [Alphaproteobacteria bacterium]|nr:DUF2141 domain-containing protein [Alphaproteobacteria bacterium]MBV9693013.1 DUF2141 domain-containing protein [Alphaproteobacteria bacterium]
MSARRARAALTAAILLAPAMRTSLHAEDIAPPPAATLTITVHNVSDAGGELRIGVFDEAGYRTKGAAPIARKRTLARGGTMTVTIEGIAPGTYAVKMFQDINGNGIFDVGMRLTEPFGISNDAQASLSLPAFDDAKIALHAGDNAIDVTLH